MSEYGYKIKNYEAGSIYGVNLGVRTDYDYTEAMLTNSLFLDFLKENGLDIYKDESTRDVICLEFNYGTRSYDEEIKHLKERAKNARTEYKIAKSHNNKECITEKKRKRDRLQNLFLEAQDKKEIFNKTSKEDIRTEFYTNGVNITYKTHNRDGKVIKSETIHYQMLYRTPGKAKKGTCMFIRDKLYKKARKFLYMGLKLPKENAPIVEIGAYSSLVTSTIVGRVQIKPEEILVLNDVDSFFKTNVVCIETDENKHCYAVDKEDYTLKNTIFDGQALIDSSIFPYWGNGYILLRHHMCKMAAFKSHIQMFFKDYFGDNYDTAIVVDMWGNKKLAKDIKLITTDNAMKWLKFDVGFDYWSDWVRQNNSMFGIVKTAHESKLGNVQRMSYQMVNSLSEDIMPSVVSESTKYIERLKTDDYIFLEYLRKNTNFSNDYEVLVALVEHNPEFIQSDYFRARKKAIINSYVLDFKNGRCIQNADNLTIVGSPYAMLLHSVGEDVNNDPTFTTEDDAIQCYSLRFNPGEYLAEFRSPFNSKNNLGHLHNTRHPLIDKYFDFGKLIIAVNMINTCFQDRNNGSDQDSDSIYTTNQPDIVEYSKYCYLNFHTIVNNIPKEKNHYSSSLEDFALVDNKLAAAQLAIGESSNLAQLALTYTYNFDDDKYVKYACILAILSQCAIDNAKRTFDIDIMAEIDRIKNDMNIKENKYPSFFTVIRKDFNKARINKELSCPMNHMYDMDFGKFRDSRKTLPMSHFFVNHDVGKDRRKSKKVEELIERFSLDLYDSKYFETKDAEEYLLLNYYFDKLVEEISHINLSGNYQGMMSWLINRAFVVTPSIKSNKDILETTLNKNKAILLKTLFMVNKKSFLNCFVKKND